MTTPAAERVRKHREANRRDGMVEFRMWVTPRELEVLNKFKADCQAMRPRPKRGQGAT